MLELAVPPPMVQSFIVAGARRAVHEGPYRIEYFRPSYEPDATPVGHLAFALKHEPLDLRLLAAAFKALGPQGVRNWMLAEPTGALARRAWFFYESLTGVHLDLPPASRGRYVEALDPERHFTGDRRNSPRHRVIDNLLGVPSYCPVVRRTERLESLVASRVDRDIKSLLASVDPRVLHRAIHYLYRRETRSTFAIEGESPSRVRSARFVAALEGVQDFDPLSKADFVALQNAIVDPRYAESDWRTSQVYVGPAVLDHRERVDFIGPKPADVAELMAGWMEMTERILASDLDPVVAAALVSFGFVLNHPFEDGNGRIHRFLVHHVLCRSGFSPKGAVFPISEAILRDVPAYYRALDTFSAPAMRLITWRAAGGGEIEVLNETADLYRHFDATPLAEYLYDRVIDTVHRDLKEELDYLARYDKALGALAGCVDMPDKRASLFVQLVLQSLEGRISKAKRPLFKELTESEIASCEDAIAEAVKT